MGWEIGYDEKHKRDIGYGVPALCDHPGCNNEINRGITQSCGGLYGGDHGCGLHFCDDHLVMHHDKDADSYTHICQACSSGESEFQPKPDIERWRRWKKTHPSWAKWREENPELAAQL